jgi:hypothetical protein
MPNIHILLNSGLNVTGHLEVGGCRITCEKMSISNQGWKKNTWTDFVDERISKGCIVTADSSLGGWTMWVEL